MEATTQPTRIDWRQVGIFTGLAYAFSGVIALVLFLSGQNQNRLVTTAMSVVFMFGPALAAWVTTRRFAPRGTAGVVLGVPRDPPPAQGPVPKFINVWWFVGWLLPVALVLAVTAVSLLLPYLSYDPSMSAFLEKLSGAVPPDQIEKARQQLQGLPIHPFWLGIPQGLMAGLSLNAIAAFGEELGWRGFLFRHLAPLGFWRCSLVTGTLWGLWHAPLILQGHNYPQHPVVGVLVMVVFCVLLSPLFHWVRIQARSTLAAAIMHGSINGLFVLPTLVIMGGNDLTSGATGVPGLITFAIANVVLAVAARPKTTVASPV